MTTTEPRRIPIEDGLDRQSVLNHLTAQLAELRAERAAKPLVLESYGAGHAYLRPEVDHPRYKRDLAWFGLMEADRAEMLDHAEPFADLVARVAELESQVMQLRVALDNEIHTRRVGVRHLEGRRGA